MHIWIGGIDKSAVAETDGIAYTIYFSGCSIKCPECHNKELWDMKSGDRLKVSALVEDIKENLELIDTVCLVGGEPTDQPEGLKELLISLQDLPISIWLYTGRDEEYVKKLDITKYCDVIKYGNYDSSYPKERGSRLATGNQYFVRNNRKGDGTYAD